jgi:hypothetical protein
MKITPAFFCFKILPPEAAAFAERREKSARRQARHSDFTLAYPDPFCIFSKISRDFRHACHHLH